MNTIESIRENMASCTDWYVDNSEFLIDMKWLIQRLEIAQKALEYAEEYLESGMHYGPAETVKQALDQLKE